MERSVVERAGSAEPIAPTRIRYIKLGEGGRWERTCIERGLSRIGFGTSQPERFALCLGGRWEELHRSLLAENPDKGRATNVANQLRTFFEDDGTILWITFHAGRLYWGMTDDSRAERDTELSATRRIRDGWRSTDIKGEALVMDHLSGALTKLAMYRGTSCDVDVRDYVVRRINGQKVAQVERALEALDHVEQAVVELMRLLTPQDFELLVDLVFSTSGWRRTGVVGGTQKTLDIDLVLPTTGERAFVQVKSRTRSAQLDDYVQRFGEEADLYSRMFYVFHSSEPRLAAPDERITLIGPTQLAKMVVDAGLVRWLIEKTS